MKRDYLIFAGSVAAAFLFLLAGAWSSPSFEEQQSYQQAIEMFGALLLAFSIVVVIASLGFYSFALYLALFFAMGVSLYGPRAGVVILGMTYAVWGLVFAMQLLLVHAGSSSALKWFREHYTTRSFKTEYKAFYPMLWIVYFLLEYLPHRITGKDSFAFRPVQLYEFMMQKLRH